MAARSTIEWTDATWHDKSAAARIGVYVSEYITMRAFGQKWCSRCRAWHDRSFFRIDRSRADGLAYTCSGNSRRINEDSRREKARAAYRAYYAGKGGDSIRASKYARKRRTAVISPKTRALVMECNGGNCVYCQSPATTIDHAVPVAHGGESKRGNLLPACRRCNSSKKDRLLYDFIATRNGADIDAIVNELVMEDVL